MAEIMVHLKMNTDNEAFGDTNTVEAQRILQKAILNLDLKKSSSKQRLLDVNGNYVGKVECFITEENFDE
tara:strand:+ start:2386 stop:2595 length:210 start_codon:yes stop_codon:yes gene_type:complete